jgi:hypothetical protein
MQSKKKFENYTKLHFSYLFEYYISIFNNISVLSGGQLYQLKKPEYPEKTTQLPHRGGQLYQLMKPKYPEKTTRTATSHTLT